MVGIKEIGQFSNLNFATSLSLTLFVLRFATALLRFSKRTLLEKAISRDACGIAATLSPTLFVLRFATALLRFATALLRFAKSAAFRTWYL